MVDFAVEFVPPLGLPLVVAAAVTAGELDAAIDAASNQLRSGFNK